VRSIILLPFILIVSGRAVGQGTWLQKANFPGWARYQTAAFSIGSCGYIGGGFGTNDFWEYTPLSNTWISKPFFPAASRGSPLTFTMNSKGYYGCGNSANGPMDDFWEYDAIINAWSQKANFGGGPRTEPFGFSINGKGYAGMGSFTADFNDLWEYNPVINTWTQKSNCPCPPTTAIDKCVFALGNIGFISTGKLLTPDFWGYDPVTDSWSQYANFPGNGRHGGVGFTLFCKGYLGLGYSTASGNGDLDDLWMFDLPSNAWSFAGSFPGGGRVDASSFTVNNRAYITCGLQVNGGMYYNDLWEFTPDSLCGSFLLSVTADSSDCTGANGTATAFPAGGVPPYSFLWSPTGQTTQTATGLSPGVHYVLVTDGNGNTSSASVSVFQNSYITFFASGSSTPCGMANGTAVVNVFSGTPPYTYLWSTGATTQLATGLPMGSYTITVTDAIGCTKAGTVNVSSIAPPVASIFGNTTICAGSSTTISAFFSGAQNYSFLWSTGQTTSYLSNISPDSTTTYWVIVANGNCSDTDSVVVNVIGSVLIVNADTMICAGEGVFIYASGCASYLWDNNGTTSMIYEQPATTTTYTVTGTTGNCTQTETITIYVNPVPLLQINVAGSPDIWLIATGSNNYLWSTGATTDSILVNPTSTSTYCVTTTNSANCSASACITIDGNWDCVPFLPTGFSPGSDGLNDRLRIMGDCLETLHLLIYDRWGEKVFETTDLNFAWDGVFKGQPLDQGVFVYYLKGMLRNGEPYTSKGNITLVR